MDKRCENKGSSWCADFMCKACPAFSLIPQAEPAISGYTLHCQGCGEPYFSKEAFPSVQKCLNCYEPSPGLEVCPDCKGSDVNFQYCPTCKDPDLVEQEIDYFAHEWVVPITGNPSTPYEHNAIRDYRAKLRIFADSISPSIEREARKQVIKEMMEFKCDECSTPGFIHLVIPIDKLKEVGE